MLIQIFSSAKTGEVIQDHSHGCLIDFPDWRLSFKNPINHTEPKPKEVNPKKIST